MAVYKSIHTGQDIDYAVSVVPDLQTGKQDKLTDVQIANINNVPNKQDKLTETQINNINAVTQLQADVDQNIGDIANLSADIINKNDVGNVTAEDTQEVHYDSVSKKLKTKAGGGGSGGSFTKIFKHTGEFFTQDGANFNLSPTISAPYETVRKYYLIIEFGNQMGGDTIYSSVIIFPPYKTLYNVYDIPLTLYNTGGKEKYELTISFDDVHNSLQIKISANSSGGRYFDVWINLYTM